MKVKSEKGASQTSIANMVKEQLIVLHANSNMCVYSNTTE